MLIKSNENKSRISYALLRVAWKLFEVDRKTRYYGTDKQLFEAEIHMIKSIKENKGIHITGLAELLGVTKGAVSQIIFRLRKKGMVTKNPDPLNLSRLILKLTPKGEKAYESHERLHQEFDNLINKTLKDVNEDKVTFLKEFLNSLEKKLDDFKNL